MTTQTLSWTLYNAARGSSSVTGALSMEYRESGDIYCGSFGPVVRCECASSVAVTVELTQQAGNPNTIEESCTSVSKDPPTAPDPTWTSSGNTRTLGFAASSAADHTWEHTARSLGDAAIGLKLTTTVKRPTQLTAS